MDIKKALGQAIAIIAIALLLYEILYVGLTTGAIGAKGVVSTDGVLVSAGFLLILLGPWLWLGEVPVTAKKLIEAKTGKKL